MLKNYKLLNQTQKPIHTCINHSKKNSEFYSKCLLRYALKHILHVFKVNLIVRSNLRTEYYLLLENKIKKKRLVQY